MKKVLFVIANLISLTCGMRMWVFNFPPRVFIFNILSMAFIIVFIVYYALNRKQFYLKKEIKYFINFQLAYLCIVVFSGVNVIYLSSGQEAFSQYFKAISSIGFNTIFFVIFILYLTKVDPKKRYKILNFYVVGVTLSCLYGIAQTILLTSFGVNIDPFIWNRISYHAGYEFGAPTWMEMGITRGKGFPGINAAATYVVTVLPLLLSRIFFYNKLKDVSLFTIALFGLLVTISRTGLLSFGVSIFILIVLERKKLFGTKSIKLIFLLSAPLGFLLYRLWRYTDVLQGRMHIDYSRLALFDSGLHIFYQHPLGVGANTYSVVRSSLPAIFFSDANLHNSWLTILVELGFVGLLFKIIFFIYIGYISLQRRSLLSLAFIAALVGLAAGAFFNQVFDLFYFNFFVVLVFTIITLENVPNQPSLYGQIIIGQK